MTQDQIWEQFNLMQQSIMAADSMTTREEFFAEPEAEQKRFYNWMCCNCGEILSGRPWY